MSISLKGRDFLTLKDFSKEEIEYMLDLSAKLKYKKKNGSNCSSYEYEKPEKPVRHSLVWFNRIFHQSVISPFKTFVTVSGISFSSSI